MDKPISLQSVFAAAETLSTEDRDLLIELMQKRQVEQRQQGIYDAPDSPTTLDSDPSVGAKTSPRVQAFKEWVETQRSSTLPTLSEEAMSRESIYGERG
jgi:hypothetical protein